MKESDLTEFQIKEEGLELCIKRGFPLPTSTTPTTQGQLPPQSPTSPDNTTTHHPIPEANIHFIKSPMVGTYYKASSPDNPPLVKVGDKVEKNTTVCILEAMKVMNEIHAEVQGTVMEILIENGQTIEYGQPLFKIKLG